MATQEDARTAGGERFGSGCQRVTVGLLSPNFGIVFFADDGHLHRNRHELDIPHDNEGAGANDADHSCGGKARRRMPRDDRGRPDRSKVARWHALMTCGTLLTLAACGARSTTFTRNDKGETTVTTTGGPGGTIVTNVASSLTPIPTDLPRWAPAYPGAKVAQVSTIAMPGRSQKMVVLMTGDARPKVVAFYDQKIAALGIKPMLSAEEAEGSMRSVGAPDGQPDSLTVGAAEGQTAISISYRAKP